MVDQDQESGDEETLFEPPPQHPPLAPMPVYNDSTPATIATGPSTDMPTMFPPTDTSVLPPPPDYSLHDAPNVPPKYTPMAGAALPVNIQMDGRLVPATMMQDVRSYQL